MKRTFIGSVIIALIISSLASLASSDLSVLNPYLKKSSEWKFPDLGKELPLRIYYLEDSTGSDDKDVVLYLKNRAWKRIGQEDDLSILQDYINKKFIVITVDFGNDPKANSPFIDNDLNGLYNAVFGFKTPSLLDDINLKPRQYRCFVLPEGYRVATDLVYWEFDKHGVYGSLEYIMETYNNEIVPKVPGMKPAQKPSDMVDRQGNPFDYRIKMDIVYPSESNEELPAFVYSETQQNRNVHGGLTEDGSHLNWFQLRGYVYIVMGHCFNPCVTHYWHFNGFTLDHWNGLACYSAGMRYIYANAEKYNINTDHIGMMGISKGQYAVTRLSDPNNAKGTESKTFAGFPEGTPQPQPCPGYPSKIHAGWQGMGMGLWESEYITPDYVPTILACGENDRDVITKEGTPHFLKRLKELDVNHIYLFMEGLGHSLSYGYDKRLGVDRYKLVIDFFDRYLKPEEKLPPVVLMVTPRNEKTDVLPGDEISVHFAPAMNEKSIFNKNGIRVIRICDNKDVEGKWQVSHAGTKFTFIPVQAFENSEQYRIVVSSRVKDRAGVSMGKEKQIQFRISDKLGK
ncbi:MAG: hypothetical protein A2W90_18610 [Bacteroidetes bacterium GWF2_42_66]|nr:MAG: hypothetical protein A2W92_05415 [Bacteroidetes bacterium GWA2_42_15]OFX98809.1 MAG: hypothetical protein A2W89_11085 [Bacteroidetes bacterium GWE2_42_39]OFY42994.1 MAG: hypothetical protein A2W90_18610 [Bacteroidetes bacterium GWF2_42_66]HBL77174.1 hypothetical protein [Prolixibacteraceae bacterium]HCU59772.1 hypothetical protein [Prolixibacteraceae bacterium]